MARFASFFTSLCLLHLIAAQGPTGQVGIPDLDVFATNNAMDTEGGQRFESAMGIRAALTVLFEGSTTFFPDQFHYGQDGVPYKTVRAINFTVERQLPNGAVAITTVNRTDPRRFSIQFNAAFSDTFYGIKGVMYHELTHVWQNHGRGTPSGVIEGVADFMRLKAGLVPAHWVCPGGGERWDQGNDVTARFLDYCTGFLGGFVWQMNAGLANGGRWNESVFDVAFGKSVHQLWKEYKETYGA